jgi:hypothetical protein
MKKAFGALPPLPLSLPSSPFVTASAQQPPPGYFDIPAGFDFPADKQTLEQYRASGNVSAQRLHVWNVFAGMTQRTPDAKYAIFETWFSEEETFQVGPAPQAVGPRRIVLPFKQPAQFSAGPGQLVPQGAGSALLWSVLYIYAGYNHVRSNRLYLSSELDTLQQSVTVDPTVSNNKDIPPFPAASVEDGVVAGRQGSGHCHSSLGSGEQSPAPERQSVHDRVRASPLTPTRRTYRPALRSRRSSSARRSPTPT